MIYTEIDSVVHGALLDEGLSIHYYIQFLNWALEVARFMSEEIPDVTLNVKSARLTVGADKAVTIPEDLVDWIRLGVQRYGYVRPLGINKSLNRLENDQASSGAYSSTLSPDSNTYEGWGLYMFGNHVSSNGEHIGGYYGYGLGENGYSYNFIPERNEIQLGDTFNQNDTVVIDYISFTADSVTASVHPYAVMAIKAYLSFKFKDMKRSWFSRLDAQNAERRWMTEYKNCKRKLHGRNYDRTTLERALRSNYGQAPKT